MVGRYSPKIRQKAGAWCSKIAAAEDAPSTSVLSDLLKVPEIDPGEALLFALTADADSSVVATGDKRGCRALASAPGLEKVRSRLRKKVLCLETCLQSLMASLGYAALRDPLTAVRDCNETLRVLLPQGARTPEDSFKEGLESYARDISAACGDLLRPTS